jgi:hypothetical protein
MLLPLAKRFYQISIGMIIALALTTMNSVVLLLPFTAPSSSSVNVVRFRYSGNQLAITSTATFMASLSCIGFSGRPVLVRSVYRRRHDLGWRRAGLPLSQPGYGYLRFAAVRRHCGWSYIEIIRSVELEARPDTPNWSNSTSGRGSPRASNGQATCWLQHLQLRRVT